jgi:soluble lytic murein transglycosylase-like protein
MRTEQRHTHFSFLTNATVFLITTAVCSFMLSAATVMKHAADVFAVAPPALAVPSPPTMIALLPEPEPEVNDQDATDVEPAPEPQIASTAPDVVIPHSHSPYHGIITQVAGRYEVDPSLIRAIIFAESGFNPRAKSKKGARGLMQLMPSTAKAMGIQDIYDPLENIEGGVKYFRLLLDRFGGDIKLALAAYNAGSRHVRNYAGIPPFKATRHYIKKVLKFQQKFKMERTSLVRRLA